MSLTTFSFCAATGWWIGGVKPALLGHPASVLGAQHYKIGLQKVASEVLQQPAKFACLLFDMTVQKRPPCTYTREVRTGSR